MFAMIMGHWIIEILCSKYGVWTIGFFFHIFGEDILSSSMILYDHSGISTCIKALHFSLELQNWRVWKEGNTWMLGVCTFGQQHQLSSPYWLLQHMLCWEISLLQLRCIEKFSHTICYQFCAENFVQENVRNC